MKAIYKEKEIKIFDTLNQIQNLLHGEILIKINSNWFLEIDHICFHFKHYDDHICHIYKTQKSI